MQEYEWYMRCGEQSFYIYTCNGYGTGNKLTWVQQAVIYKSSDKTYTYIHTYNVCEEALDRVSWAITHVVIVTNASTLQVHYWLKTRLGYVLEFWHTDDIVSEHCVKIQYITTCYFTNCCLCMWLVQWVQCLAVYQSVSSRSQAVAPPHGSIASESLVKC